MKINLDSVKKMLKRYLRFLNNLENGTFLLSKSSIILTRWEKMAFSENKIQ